MVSEHLISTSNRGSVYGATIVSAVDPLHDGGEWGGKAGKKSFVTNRGVSGFHLTNIW